MEYLKIEKSQDGLFAKFTELKNNELNWFEKEALNLLGIKKLPSKS